MDIQNIERLEKELVRAKKISKRRYAQYVKTRVAGERGSGDLLFYEWRQSLGVIKALRFALGKSQKAI